MNIGSQRAPVSGAKHTVSKAIAGGGKHHRGAQKTGSGGAASCNGSLKPQQSSHSSSHASSGIGSLNTNDQSSNGSNGSSDSSASGKLLKKEHGCQPAEQNRATDVARAVHPVHQPKKYPSNALNNFRDRDRRRQKLPPRFQQQQYRRTDNGFQPPITAKRGPARGPRNQSFHPQQRNKSGDDRRVHDNGNNRNGKPRRKQNNTPHFDANHAPKQENECPETGFPGYVAIPTEQGRQLGQQSVPLAQMPALALQNTYSTHFRLCACPMNCQQFNYLIDIFNEKDFLGLICSNPKCGPTQIIHRACLTVLESYLVQVLKQTSLTHGFSDKDRKSQIWEQYERWHDHCEQFRKNVQCRNSKCAGHVRLDPSFDVAAFVAESGGLHGMVRVQARPGSSMSALLPTPKGDNVIEGAQLTEVGLKESSSKPVHNPKKLPAVWEVQAIEGDPKGVVKELGLRENWLRDDFSMEKIDAVQSEIDWLQAKNRYSKRLNGQMQEDGTTTELQLSPMPHTKFPPRYNYNDIVEKVPITKLNPYNIMMEAGGQSFGVDDLRTHCLSNLSQCHTNSLNCCLCAVEMQIYHHFPLLAGTMFLSSETNKKSGGKVPQLQHGIHNRNSFLLGICLECLEGRTRKVTCNFCEKPWSGSSFQIGTLHSFDIFACFPCCEDRIRCKDCNQPVLKNSSKIKHFSQYSESIACPHCSISDYHLVRSTDTYTCTEIGQKFNGQQLQKIVEQGELNPHSKPFVPRERVEKMVQHVDTSMRRSAELEFHRLLEPSDYISSQGKLPRSNTSPASEIRAVKRAKENYTIKFQPIKEEAESTFLPRTVSLGHMKNKTERVTERAKNPSLEIDEEKASSVFGTPPINLDLGRDRFREKANVYPEAEQFCVNEVSTGSPNNSNRFLRSIGFTSNFRESNYDNTLLHQPSNSTGDAQVPRAKSHSPQSMTIQEDGTRVPGNAFLPEGLFNNEAS